MLNTLSARSLVRSLTTAAVLLSAGPARAQYLLLSPTLVGADADEIQPGEPTIPRLTAAPTLPAPASPVLVAADASVLPAPPALPVPPALPASPALVRPGLFQPFTDVLGDFRHVPSRENVDWLVIGLGAAIGSRTVDRHVSHEFSGTRIQSFKPGAILGATPLALGASFATYAFGRASGSSLAMGLGGDLVRAQLLAEAMTIALKQSIRRSRPEGTGFSFPSGHTTVSFASATVFQQHFGWKAGVPAYAVASYIAASRVQMKRHYLSDVAFGAALGIISGRTVTLGRRQQWVLTPVAANRGGGLGLTFAGRR